MRKKAIFTFLLCAVTVTCVGAGASGCNTKPAHTHSYTESVVPPTCTENGYTLHSCDCGVNYTDNQVEATGHNETVVDGKAATCTENGLTAGKRCTVCNTYTVQQQVVNATGHSYAGGRCTVCGEPDPDIKFTEQLTYAAIEENGKTVAYSVSGLSDDTVPHVIIPEEHEGLPVTKIGAKAFYNMPNIKSITVPDTVEKIEAQAFYWCSGLESLHIGKGLKTIENYALGGCFSLKTIDIDTENATLKSESNCIIDRETLTVKGGCTASVIPASAKGIDSYAFAYCATPETLIIPANVTSIGENAFYYCYNLKNVTVEATSATIGARAFSYAQSLESAEINCEEVGAMAFNYCLNLTHLTIGENVKEFTSSRVTGCYKLIDIYNKSSLPLTTYTSAYNKYSLETVRNIYADESQKGAFSDVNGYKFYTFSDSGKDEYYLIGYYGEETELNLPSPSQVKFSGKTVNSYKINWHALRGLTKITKIVIPDGVTEIGQSAIQATTALESVTIGNSVTRILNNAFWGATKLTELTVPENVSYVELNAFKGLTALTTVNWNAVECTTNVDLKQNSITNITAQNRIFYGCDNLKNVTFGNNVKRIPEALFRGCTSITSITIPKSVNTIGAAAFYSCTNLANVIFEDRTSSWTTAFNAEGTGSTSNPPKPVTSAQISSSATAAQMLAALEDYKYAGYGTNYWHKQ